MHIHPKPSSNPNQSKRPPNLQRQNRNFIKSQAKISKLWQNNTGKNKIKKHAASKSKIYQTWATTAANDMPRGSAIASASEACLLAILTATRGGRRLYAARVGDEGAAECPSSVWEAPVFFVIFFLLGFLMAYLDDNLGGGHSVSWATARSSLEGAGEEASSSMKGRKEEGVGEVAGGRIQQQERTFKKCNGGSLIWYPWAVVAYSHGLDHLAHKENHELSCKIFEQNEILSSVCLYIYIYNIFETHFC